jgi:hypothetical protein
MAMDNGWEASADAWIADMDGDHDFSRSHVLDAPMLADFADCLRRSALPVSASIRPKR